MVPHTPDTEDEEYDPWMPISSSLMDVEDVKPFEEDDESFEEEKEEDPFEDEDPDKELGGGPTDISPYPNSTSHDAPVEHAETQDGDPTKLESLPEEAIPIPSLKKEASSPFSPRPSKKLYPTHK